MLVVSVRLPDLPVTVTVDVPGTAAAVTAKVTATLAGVAPGPNDPTTPAGRPDRLTVTEPAKPLCGVRVSTLFPLAPIAMLRAAGETDNENAGGPVTASEIVSLLVRLPEVPVTVTEEVLGGAPLAAVKVTVLLLAVVAGLKAAVTPLGRPEAVSATVPANPPWPLMAMVLVMFAPCARLRLAGVAESVKPGGGVTVRAMVVLLVAVPEAPDTVIVEVPAAALLDALKVSVLVFVDAVGLKVAVTPVGSPLTENVTVPLKPLCGVTVMVLVPVAPSTTVTLAGVAARVKDGVPVTVSLIVAVLLRLPDVPVMVTV